MSAALRVKIKEKPILFSGPMIRAILEGRKTQTRRVITDERIKAFAPGYADDRGRIIGMCPYGRVGDRLWVRETCWLTEGVNYALYVADGHKFVADWKKKPSIFMPRWASRITLEITNIRVERLQETSEADAIAEGIQRSERTDMYPSPEGNCDHAVWAFKYGWDSLNAKRGYSWESNPWVWVIEFRKL